MKKTSSQTAATRGTAMFTTLIIMGVLAFVTTSMIYMTMQQPYNVRRTRDHLRAQAIAEAGANIAYAMLCTNWGLKDNPAAFPVTSYRNGTYAVSIASMSATSAVISSTGHYNSVTAMVAMDVKNNQLYQPAGPPPPVGAYSNLVTAGGTIWWGGTVTIQGGGRVHANQSASYSGTVNLAADASSSTELDANGHVQFNNTFAPTYKIVGSVDINGIQTTAPVPVVPIPQLDLVPYYNAALANGQVYNNDVGINQNTAPAGGIMWVNGNLFISGNCTLTGCFIATGTITISGNGQQVQVGNYPAFVSQNSDIKISGGKNLNGLLYTKVGNITYTGGGNLTGAIICGGSLSMSGNVGIFAYSNPTPVPPGSNLGTMLNNVGISAWRQ